MRTSYLLLAAAAIATVSAATGSAWADDCDSVPAGNFTVAAPAANAGAAAGFSGTWQGVWTIKSGIKKSSMTNVTYCSRLSVSVTGPQSADVMYCLGSQPAARIAPGCARYQAKIEGDRLMFTSRANLSYDFTQAGGSLTGRYQSPVRPDEQPTTTFEKH